MKMTDQQGWSTRKVLCIVIILLLLSSTGWYAFRQAHHQSSTATLKPVAAVSQPAATQSQPDGYAGWRTYSGNSISFRYPGSWTLDESGISRGILELNAPIDKGIRLFDLRTQKASTVATDQHLTATINFSPGVQASQRQCMAAGITANTCMVADASPVTIGGSATAKLVISDFDNVGHPNILDVSDDPAAAVSATSYKKGLVVKGKLLFLGAFVTYKDNSKMDTGGELSDGELADVAEFKTTQSYKDLLRLFTSVTLK